MGNFLSAELTFDRLANGEWVLDVHHGENAKVANILFRSLVPLFLTVERQAANTAQETVKLRSLVVQVQEAVEDQQHAHGEASRASIALMTPFLVPVFAQSSLLVKDLRVLLQSISSSSSANNVNNNSGDSTSSDVAALLHRLLVLSDINMAVSRFATHLAFHSNSPLQRKAAQSTMQRIEQSRSLWMEQHPAAPLLLFAPGLLPDVTDAAAPALAATYALADGPPTHRTGTATFWNLHSMMCHTLLSVAVSNWGRVTQPQQSASASTTTATSATTAGGGAANNNNKPTASERMMRYDRNNTSSTSTTHTFESVLACALHERGMTVVASVVVDILNGFLRGQPDGRRFDRGCDALSAAINHFCGTRFVRGAATQPEFVGPVLRHEWNYATLRSMFLCPSVPLSAGANDVDGGGGASTATKRAANDNASFTESEEDPALLFGLVLPSPQSRGVLSAGAGAGGAGGSGAMTASSPASGFVASHHLDSEGEFNSSGGFLMSHGDLGFSEGDTFASIMANPSSSSFANASQQRRQSGYQKQQQQLEMSGSSSSSAAALKSAAASGSRSVNELLNTSVSKILADIKKAFAVRRINAELVDDGAGSNRNAKKKRRSGGTSATRNAYDSNINRSSSDDDDDDDDDGSSDHHHHQHGNDGDGGGSSVLGSDDDDEGSSTLSADEQAENAAFHDDALLAPPGAIVLHPRHILQRATMHGKDTAVKKLIREVQRLADDEGGALSAQDMNLSGTIRLDDWRQRLAARKSVDRSAWALLCVDGQDSDPVADLDAVGGGGGDHHGGGGGHGGRSQHHGGGGHHSFHSGGGTTMMMGIDSKRFMTAFVFARRKRRNLSPPANQQQSSSVRRGNSNNNNNRSCSPSFPGGGGDDDHHGGNNNVASTSDDLLLIQAALRASFLIVMDDLAAAMSLAKNEQDQHQIGGGSSSSASAASPSSSSPTSSSPLGGKKKKKNSKASSNPDGTATATVMTSQAIMSTIQTALDQFCVADYASSLHAKHLLPYEEREIMKMSMQPQQQHNSHSQHHHPLSEHGRPNHQRQLSSSASSSASPKKSKDQSTSVVTSANNKNVNKSNQQQQQQHQHQHQQQNDEYRYGHHLRAVWQGTTNPQIAGALDQLYAHQFGATAASSSVVLTGGGGGAASSLTSDVHHHHHHHLHHSPHNVQLPAAVWSEIHIAVEKHPPPSTPYDEQAASLVENYQAPRVCEMYKLFVKLPPPEMLSSAKDIMAAVADMTDLASWYLQVAPFSAHATVHELHNVFLHAPSFQQAVAAMVAFHSRNEEDPDMKALFFSGGGDSMMVDDPTSNEINSNINDFGDDAHAGDDHVQQQQDPLLRSLTSSDLRTTVAVAASQPMISSSGGGVGGLSSGRSSSSRGGGGGGPGSRGGGRVSPQLEKQLRLHTGQSTADMTTSQLEAQAKQLLQHARSMEVVGRMRQEWDVEKNLLTAHVYNEKHALAVERERRRKDLTSFKRMLKEQPTVGSLRSGSTSPTVTVRKKRAYRSTGGAFGDDKDASDLDEDDLDDDDLDYHKFGGGASSTDRHQDFNSFKSQKSTATPIDSCHFIQGTSSSARKARPPSAANREVAERFKRKMEKDRAQLAERQQQQQRSATSLLRDALGGAAGDSTINRMVISAVPSSAQQRKAGGSHHLATAVGVNAASTSADSSSYVDELAWHRLEYVLAKWAQATDSEHAHVAALVQTEMQNKALAALEAESQLRRPWPGGPLHEFVLQEAWRPPLFHSAETDSVIALSTLCSIMFWDPTPPTETSEVLISSSSSSHHRRHHNHHHHRHRSVDGAMTPVSGASSNNSSDDGGDDDGSDSDDDGDDDDDDDASPKSRLIKAEAAGALHRLALFTMQNMMWPPAGGDRGMIQNTWVDALQYPIVPARAMFAVTSLLDVDFTQRHSQRRVWKLGLHLALLRLLADRDQPYDIKVPVCKLLVSLANDKLCAVILHEFGIERVICRELFAHSWFAFRPPSAGPWAVNTDIVQYAVQLLTLGASVMSVLQASAQTWVRMMTPSSSASSSSSSSNTNVNPNRQQQLDVLLYFTKTLGSGGVSTTAKLTPEMLGALLSNMLRYVRRSCDDAFPAPPSSGTKSPSRHQQHNSKSQQHQRQRLARRSSNASNVDENRSRGHNNNNNNNNNDGASSTSDSCSVVSSTAAMLAMYGSGAGSRTDTKTNAALGTAVLVFSTMFGMRRSFEGQKPHLARRLLLPTTAATPATPSTTATATATNSNHADGSGGGGGGGGATTTSGASLRRLKNEGDNNNATTTAAATGPQQTTTGSAQHQQQQQQQQGTGGLYFQPPSRKNLTMGFTALVEATWSLTKRTGANKYINVDDKAEAATLCLQSLGTMTLIGDEFPRIDGEESAARLFATLVEMVSCFACVRIMSNNAAAQKENNQHHNPSAVVVLGGGLKKRYHRSGVGAESGAASSSSTSSPAGGDEPWRALCSRCEVDRLGAVRVTFISKAHARLFLGAVVALSRVLNGELLFDHARNDWTGMAGEVARLVLPVAMEILSGMLTTIALPSMKAVSDMRRCTFLGVDFPPLQPCPPSQQNGDTGAGGGGGNGNGDDDGGDNEDDNADDAESKQGGETSSQAPSSMAMSHTMGSGSGAGGVGVGVGAGGRKKRDSGDPSLIVTFHLSALVAVTLRNCSPESRVQLARRSAELLVALVDLDSAYFQKWFAKTRVRPGGAGSSMMSMLSSSPSATYHQQHQGAGSPGGPAAPSPGGGGANAAASSSSGAAGAGGAASSSSPSSASPAASAGAVTSSRQQQQQHQNQSRQHHGGSIGGSAGFTSSDGNAPVRGEAIAATSPVGRLVHGIRQNVANALELLAVDPEAAAKLRIGAVPVLLAVLRNTAIAPLASSCAAALVALASHDAVNFVTNNHDALGTMLSALHRGPSTSFASSATSVSASVAALSPVTSGRRRSSSSYHLQQQQQQASAANTATTAAPARVDDTTLTMLAAAVAFLSAVLRSRATQASSKAYDSMATQIDNMLLGHIGRIPHFLAINGVTHCAATEASCNLVGETAALAGTILLHCPGLRGVLDQDHVVQRVTRALCDGLLPKLLRVSPPHRGSNRSASVSSVTSAVPPDSSVVSTTAGDATGAITATAQQQQQQQPQETSKVERARLDQARRVAASKCIAAIDEASRLNPDCVSKTRDLNKLLDVLALLLSGEGTIPDPNLYAKNIIPRSPAGAKRMPADVASRALSFCYRLLAMEQVTSFGIVDGLLTRGVTPHIVGLLAHENVTVQELAGDVMRSLRSIHNREPSHKMAFQFNV